MADVWTCANCKTVNAQHSSRCLACQTIKKEATAAVLAETEAPATMVSTVASPIRPSPVKPSAASAVKPGPSPRMTTEPSPRAETRPPAPVHTLTHTPVLHGRRRSRHLATGKFLGIGHIGLFITAILVALTEVAWGRDVLRWANHPTIAADVGGWWVNPIIRDATNWSNDLPWGAANWPYLTLGAACLVMRLWRRLPGPVSLLLALPAAVYGILAVVAELPSLVILWPIALGALIVSWVVVGKTIR